MRVGGIAKLAVLSLALGLAACDKIDQFLGKQDNLANRVGALESQVASLNGRVAALQEKQSENSDSYSTCVLNNMKGVTNDLAAQAVEESCLRKASSPLLDVGPLKGSTAGYGKINGLEQRLGLYLTVDNKTEYTLTEISVVMFTRRARQAKGGAPRSLKSERPLPTT